MTQATTNNGPKTALIIALTGIGAMIAVGAYKFAVSEGVFQTLIAVIMISYIAWILSEFKITTGENKRDANDDQGTCEAYAIARFITMLAALAFNPVWETAGPWLPIGLVLFFGGIALRAYAIYTLGQFYSHRVRTPNGKTIISHGPYRFLRHPAYTGMLVAHVGILVLFFNWFLLVAVFGVFVPALVRRIRVEETHLLAIPEYREFAASRARLAPGIW